MFSKLAVNQVKFAINVHCSYILPLKLDGFLLQFLFLLPGYLLQMTFGMNTAFTAILTPQLMETGSEFEITEDQESWIVSMDNFIIPFMSILSGNLQTNFGPALVGILEISTHINFELNLVPDVASCLHTIHNWLDIGVFCFKHLVHLRLQTFGWIKPCLSINIHLCSGDLYRRHYESHKQFSSKCCKISWFYNRFYNGYVLPLENHRLYWLDCSICCWSLVIFLSRVSCFPDQ